MLKGSQVATSDLILTHVWYFNFFYVVLIFVNWSCSVLAGYVEKRVGGDVVCGSK